MRAMIAGALLTCLAACAGEPRQEGASPDSTGGNAVVAEPVAPPQPPAPVEGVSIERKDEVLEFSYGWPAAAHAIAPLDEWLRSHAETQYRKAHDGAEEGRKAAAEGGYPFNAYMYQQGWEAVADTPSVLAMQGDGYSFTGGAHGLPFTVALIWDKTTRRRLATGDVIDLARLARAAREAFCKELDRQREEKRGAPVNPDEESAIPEFNRCVDMAQQEIVPLSRGGRALDGIRIVIGPYEAGPYVEGSYEIDLPMTQAMMDAVKPAYRGWFAVGTP